MGWSIAIGTVKGTVVKLHFTFLLFLGWIVIASYAQAGPQAAVGAGIFFLLLFLCVVLHEFGHILTARRFGVRTPDVTLLPIGGIARLERIPEQPRQEFLIAMAGPAVNVVIGLFLIMMIGGFPAHTEISFSNMGSNLIVHLAYANLALALFNLIPAFPMDGGRALRAMLSASLGYARGTRIAARVGQTLAVILGIYGLMIGHVILAVIALFVYVAAGSEAGLAQMRRETLGAIAADLMLTDFRTLSADATVGEAAEALLRTSQRDFPVVDRRGTLKGILTRDGIIKGLREGGATTLAVSLLQAGVPSISARHNADEAVQLLQGGAPVVAVTDSYGKLAGLITWENLLELLLISNAKAGRRSAPGMIEAAAARS